MHHFYRMPFTAKSTADVQQTTGVSPDKEIRLNIHNMANLLLHHFTRDLRHFYRERAAKSATRFLSVKRKQFKSSYILKQQKRFSGYPQLTGKTARRVVHGTTIKTCPHISDPKIVNNEGCQIMQSFSHFFSACRPARLFTEIASVIFYREPAGDTIGQSFSSSEDMMFFMPGMASRT